MPWSEKDLDHASGVWVWPSHSSKGLCIGFKEGVYCDSETNWMDLRVSKQEMVPSKMVGIAPVSSIFRSSWEACFRNVRELMCSEQVAFGGENALTDGSSPHGNWSGCFSPCRPCVPTAFPAPTAAGGCLAHDTLDHV